RLTAVQALYQVDLNAQDIEGAILEFLTHRSGPVFDDQETLSIDAEFFSDVVRGTLRRRNEIDAALERTLVAGWPLSRLDSVLRALLRCGCYELLVRRDIPAKVVINEYVEISHAFFGG